MSRRMVSPGLPQVLRVLNAVPSVITTLISWYSGWIFSFMAALRLRRGVIYEASGAMQATPPSEFLVEEGAQLAGGAVGPHGVAGDLAVARPAQPVIEALGVAAGVGVEDQQRAADAACLGLGGAHQQGAEALPPGAAMDQ